MRILIIEDNPELGAMWRLLADGKGCEVSWAQNASEGLYKLAADGPYDIILSDLLLGDGNAFGLLDYARVKHPKSRIVLITGATQYANGQLHELSASVDWVLHKPVPVADVEAIIDFVAETLDGPAQPEVAARS